MRCDCSPAQSPSSVSLHCAHLTHSRPRRVALLRIQSSQYAAGLQVGGGGPRSQVCTLTARQHSCKARAALAGALVPAPSPVGTEGLPHRRGGGPAQAGEEIRAVQLHSKPAIRCTEGGQGWSHSRAGPVCVCCSKRAGATNGTAAQPPHRLACVGSAPCTKRSCETQGRGKTGARAAAV